MKKSHWFVGILFVISVVLCIIFLQQKNAEHKKMEDLCQSSISMAFDDFIAYQNLQKDSDYTSGVAHFRSFMIAYLFLNDNVSDTNYIWCNTLYGDMLLHPETVKSNMADLVDALGYLDEYFSSPQGFHKLNELINKLTLYDD